MSKNAFGGGDAWVTNSDLASAITAVLFKYSLPSFAGSYGMLATRAFVISVIARMVPGYSTSVTSINDSQKSAIVVAILGGVSQMIWYKNSSVMSGVVGSVSIDLLGNELLNLLGLPTDAFGKA